MDSLSVGGFGWVTNLTARDPTMIFPIAIGMSNFLNVEVMILSIMGLIVLPNKCSRL
jgi:membrane protein insertase Oxa1/YidC/SpoIIIJ